MSSHRTDTVLHEMMDLCPSIIQLQLDLEVVLLHVLEYRPTRLCDIIVYWG